MSGLLCHYLLVPQHLKHSWEKHPSETQIILLYFGKAKAYSVLLDALGNKMVLFTLHVSDWEQQLLILNAH